MSNNLIVFFCFFWLGIELSTAQFDPHAGIVRSYTENALVEVSSATPGTFPSSIIDGSKTTFWQSGGALPSGFLVRDDLNILLDLGGTAAVTNSASLSDTAITDGDVYTALQIPATSGKAWVKFDLGIPTPFRSLSFKGAVSADSMNIWLYHTAGDSIRFSQLCQMRGALALLVFGSSPLR